MKSLYLSDIDRALAQRVAELTVSEHQRRYVADNSKSLAETRDMPGALPRAILVDTTPVGFVLLFDPTAENARARGPIRPDQLGLWRLMIAHPYQGRGFGRRTIELCCQYARHRGCFDEILSSCVDAPEGPKAFYLRCGFIATGHRRNKGSEIEIVRPL